MRNKPLYISLIVPFMTGLGQAQTLPAPAVHTDSAYARELLHLKQLELMEGELARAKGTAAEDLWRAQVLQARYDELVKDPVRGVTVTQEYLGALAAYIKGQEALGGRGDLDGAWALDHAQFILSHLSQPILTRMEYFSNNPRDRAALMPLATAAEQLLRIAGSSLNGTMKQLEAAKPFDEKGYNRAYSAAAETRYYATWAAYFHAMALNPAVAGDVDERKKLLATAVDGLAEWAIDTSDNGVNYQSYLLRGKAEAEEGNAAQALADFAKAQSEKGPAWVQYQARYQTVVVHLKAGNFAEAQGALESFKKSIPVGNAEALISADMLGYRVAWAAAEAKVNVPDRKRAEKDALDILGGIVQRDGRFRDLVYDQLAAQIPENAELNALFPIQQLALARTASVNQKGDTPESRRQLGLALQAAAAVRIHPQANGSDKLEAAFLQGVCQALLGNLAEAAGFEVEFATLAPKDPRARQMIDLALQQIGELRKSAATQGLGAGTAPATGLSPELRALAERALDISTRTFGDTHWLYAQGRLLEESGKADDAVGVYQKIKADDRNYLEARYRLVALATEKFGSLEGKGTAKEQQAAAGELFAACQTFMALLDHPPASAPKETLAAAQGYRYNIWLIEAATALTPGVKNAEVALDRIGRLEAAREKLTEGQRNTLLRYRVEAYQLAGQPEKARQVLGEFAKTGPEALASIRSMALAAQDQIDRTTDAAEVRRQAAYVVMLLDPIVGAAEGDGKQDNAFEYRLIQADMMTRAGEYLEAQALAVKLQKERPEDIRAFQMEARSVFAKAQVNGDLGLYAKAQDYFTRILGRLAPGSESFWEAWLRIMQAMEAQTVGQSTEIKAKLGDLKAIYGEQFGGTRFKGEFGKLAGKYGV